jgi:hypothetical protein
LQTRCGGDVLLYFLDIERIAVVRLQNQSYLKQNNKHQIINQLKKNSSEESEAF